MTKFNKGNHKEISPNITVHATLMSTIDKHFNLKKKSNIIHKGNNSIWYNLRWTKNSLTLLVKESSIVGKILKWRK